jgi:sigma-B regulation protein RsbU (phosphoserine phosphatase)
MKKYILIILTTFCGILNIHTGEVCYTNAGHNPPLLLPQGNPAEFVAETRSTIVGIDEEAEFQEARLTLAAGNSLCLYTDGVTEAFNPEEDMFSEERLQQEAASSPQETMEIFVQTILHNVHAFAGEMPQTDDITVLGLRCIGNERAS